MVSFNSILFALSIIATVSGAPAAIPADEAATNIPKPQTFQVIGDHIFCREHAHEPACIGNKMRREAEAVPAPAPAEIPKPQTF
ncbi:hypothetical protein HDU97_005611 [Phlyctochytrium planicorne]|nr:hypothetical protein HDU97_005611 [Phlyctochytrium planicorne]